MTITEFNGDLLSSGCDIICHQVNCKGVMGAGIALQIKKKYPEVFSNYKHHCILCSNALYNLLGSALLVGIGDGKYIANLFGQYTCGTKGCFTNYTALQEAFRQVALDAPRLNCKTIGIPYGIGCGLAGGDWTKVYKIILETFDDTDLDLQIWRYDNG